MRRATEIVLLCTLFLAGPAFGAQNTAEEQFEHGRAKSLQCASCHGLEGVSRSPNIPILAGQKALYLRKQLHHFREGTRYHAMMTPVARALSDDDIDDLAAYFSEIEDVAAPRATSQ